MRLITFLSFIMLMCILCLPVLVQAQIDDPGGDPASVPIDGGLSLLLAAGIGYGVKKAYSSRKKKNEEKEKDAIL